MIVENIWGLLKDSKVNTYSIWLHCLKQNTDYQAYCAAKRVDNAFHTNQLESKYVSLAQVYEDFGDVTGVSADTSSASYQQWQSRRDFILYEKDIELAVKQVDDLATYTFQDNHLLLDVTLFGSKTATLAEITAFIDNIYKQQRIVFKSNDRYPLHENLFNVQSMLRFEKALYVGSLDEALSLSDTILHIKRDRSSPFGWSLTAEEAESVKGGTFTKLYVTASSEAVIVSRCRTDFKAVVANTIHGRFPDYT